MNFTGDYVVCIGRTIQDDYYRLDRMPTLGNKVNSVFVESRPGGGMANTSCALAAFGTKTYLVGPIGDDFLTESLLESVSCHGADTSYMYRDPGQKNFLHEIFLYENERIIMLHRGEKLLDFRPDASTYALVDHGAVLYSDVMSFGYFPNPVEMLRRAKAKGTRIFIDGEPGSIASPEEAETYFSLADILSLNDFAMDFYCGDKGEDKIRTLIGDSDKIVLLTKADKGVIVLTRDGRWEVPACKVKAVDTTGAGDTFNAAFMHRLIQGDAPADAASFGCKAAAYCVSHLGARSGAVPEEEILRFFEHK